MIAELSWPLLVRIHIGPLALSPHGIGIAVGFLAGARLMMPAAEEAGIPREDTQRMLGWALVGAIVGARLFYVLNHAGELDSPLEALAHPRPDRQPMDSHRDDGQRRGVATGLRSGRPHPPALTDGFPRDENATMASLRQEPE